MAQMVKNLPATWQTWVRSLSWEDPLEKGTATHSNILTWRNSMERGAQQATVHGVVKSWTRLSDFHFYFQDKEDHWFFDSMQQRFCKLKLDDLLLK